MADDELDIFPHFCCLDWTWDKHTSLTEGRSVSHTLSLHPPLCSLSSADSGQDTHHSIEVVTGIPGWRDQGCVSLLNSLFSLSPRTHPTVHHRRLCSSLLSLRTLPY